LTNALVFVLPSSLEGSPMALLEAYGHGLCCLASDIPPHREAVRSGEDGLLFKHRDRADLTRQLTRLVCDGTQRQRLGRAARVKVGRAPEWKEVARRHEMLYNEAAPEAAVRPKRRRPA
jgi:glycosyltransferase involved in cell wall biosynthesis